MGATPGENKKRKKELFKRGEIKCPLCPYHKTENFNRRKRKPKSDKHKNHR